MKCLILAAGYATRLYPLTENFPKPLLEINGKAIIDYLVDDIGKSSFVDGFIVVTNHKYVHCFSDWAKGKNQKITVLDDGTTSNETRLGAVKDIRFAVEKLNIGDDLLVVAGDNVLDFSLTEFIDYSREKEASCIMRYFEPDEVKLLNCGVVEVDENDKVLSMTEKSPTPATNWCCPPFYYYNEKDIPLIARSIDEGCPTDSPGRFAAWLCGKSTVYAMQMPGRRFDIGNIESYEKIKSEYKGIS